MDVLKLIHGFVTVVLCISHPLSNKTKLKFDQDLKVCWSLCFEQKVIESKYSMHGVWCASGNFFCIFKVMILEIVFIRLWMPKEDSVFHAFRFWIFRAEGCVQSYNIHINWGSLTWEKVSYLVRLLSVAAEWSLIPALLRPPSSSPPLFVRLFGLS